jgi:hypothetical protein
MSWGVEILWQVFLLLLFSVAKGNKKRAFHPAHSCGPGEDPWSGQTSHLGGSS